MKRRTVPATLDTSDYTNLKRASAPRPARTIIPRERRLESVADRLIFHR